MQVRNQAGPKQNRFLLPLPPGEGGGVGAGKRRPRPSQAASVQHKPPAQPSQDPLTPTLSRGEREK